MPLTFSRLASALRQRGRSALAVVLIYACFAALWILLSDHAVERLFRTPEAMLLASTLKGWLFVAITSVLLYVLLRQRGAPAAEAAERLGPRLPLRSTLLLLGLAVSAAVALAVWHNLRSERERVAEQLQAISQAKATEIGGWLGERLRDAGWAHKSMGLQEAWLRWRDSQRPLDAQRLRLFLTSFSSATRSMRASTLSTAPGCASSAPARPTRPERSTPPRWWSPRCTRPCCRR